MVVTIRRRKKRTTETVIANGNAGLGLAWLDNGRNGERITLSLVIADTETERSGVHVDMTAAEFDAVVAAVQQARWRHEHYDKRV